MLCAPALLEGWGPGGAHHAEQIKKEINPLLRADPLLTAVAFLPISKNALQYRSSIHTQPSSHTWVFSPHLRLIYHSAHCKYPKIRGARRVGREIGKLERARGNGGLEWWDRHLFGHWVFERGSKRGVKLSIAVRKRCPCLPLRLRLGT